MKIYTRFFAALFAAALSAALAVITACAAEPHLPPRLARQKASPQTQARVRQALRRQPLGFEANTGQFDREVRFVSRGRDHGLYLTATGAVLTLHRGRRESPALTRQRPRADVRTPASISVANLKLIGSNPAPKIFGADELPGKANYILGNDPALWHKNLPRYARVHYAAIYPGVDLVFYGNGGRLEYDFIVSPGADPSAISFTFASGSKSGSMHTEPSLRLEPNGDLALTTTAGDVRLHHPVIYQEQNGERHTIPGGYELKADGSIGFDLGQFDTTRPLIIDPVLSFSTFLGGSGVDSATAIALDSSDNIYIAGTTTSSNFPVTAGGFQHTLADDVTQCTTSQECTDAFVSKLSPDGSTLIYSTYLGGAGTDGIRGIAVDSSDNAYVAGFTGSLDFPGVGANSFQASSTGGTCASVPCLDAFFAKLNNEGSGILYSTYLGGSNIDIAHDIAVDSSGNAYLTGYTASPDFPATRGAPGGGTCAGGPTPSPCVDAFVGKFNPSLSGAASLVYLTYLGGNGDDVGFAIRVDSGNAYVAGTTFANDTGSATFPVTAGAFQNTFGGGVADGFLAVLDSNGNLPPVYATFLGGSMEDDILDLALYKASGTTFAFVTGSTLSDDFPASTGSYQRFCNLGGGQPHDCADAFLAKFNPSEAGATSRVFSTFLGGGGDDESNAISVDSTGSAVVAGTTGSANFPTLAAVQSSYGGGARDVFVTKFNSDGSGLIYSTYLGGTRITGDIEEAFALATDSADAVVVAGQTSDSGFPVLNALFPDFGGGDDAFVAKLVPAFSISPDTASKTISAGQSATFQIAVGPDMGFSEDVNLGCSVTPVVTLAPTCSFSPNVISTSAGPGVSTLTIQTTGTATAGAISWPAAPRVRTPAGTNLMILGLFLGLLIVLWSVISRKRYPLSLIAAMLLVVFMWASCASGGGNNNYAPPPPARTPTGNYTVTVTSTSGRLSNTAGLTVTIN
ncbi:MAG TPA: SBBP repeat-containing protein [Terriglobia bacterium]|nr:SBBP repeat-containing protein [Terriglobia bacterium]